MKLKLLGALAALGLLFASCSKDSDSSLLAHIPADADMALVINVKKVIESAGGSVVGDFVTPPASFAAFDANKSPELNGSGLDLSNLGMWVDSGNEMIFQVLKINDRNKLTTYLGVHGLSKIVRNGEYSFYKSNHPQGIYSQCVVAEDFVYFYSDPDAPVAFLTKLLDETAQKPLASTGRGKYLAEGNAGGASITVPALQKLIAEEGGVSLPLRFDGNLCAKLDVEKDEIVLKTVVLDKEGAKMTPDDFGVSFDKSATVSAEALSYFSPAQCLVYGAALKDVDWDAAFREAGRQIELEPMQMMVMGMVKEYFKKIDGTVALGIGFDGDSADIRKIEQGEPVLNYLPLTLVIQTSSGKAKGFLGDISAVLAAVGITPTDLGDGFSAHIPGDAGMLYGKTEGNNVILSTRPIEKYNNDSATKGLAGNFAGLGLYIPADYPLARDLRIKDNLSVLAVSDLAESEATVSIKITGDTKGGIIERIFNLFNLYKKGFENI